MYTIVMVRIVKKRTFFFLGIIFARLLGLFNTLHSNLPKNGSVFSPSVSADVPSTSCDLTIYTPEQCGVWVTYGIDAGGAGCCSAGSSSDVGGSGTGGDGDGGGDGSVICTELHRQGILTSKTFQADRKFGVLLRSRDPFVYVGYMVWAPAIVSLMKKSNLITKIVSIFAIPWARHMAHITEGSFHNNYFGEVVMGIGVPFCRMIGKTKSFLKECESQYLL